MAERTDGGRPEIDVSVIIANYNGERFIADAIRSACNQSLRNMEVIVSDDASTDSSVQIVRSLIAEDDRIRLIESRVNGGAAAARNRALDAARGQWVSILDSDDLMHPGRILSLIEEATKSNADIVADDLLLFDTDSRVPPQTLFAGRWSSAANWVSAADYLATNNFYGMGPALGYLKPVIRTSLITRQKIRYDERLTIAEDYNFVFRLLMAGAKFRTIPEIGYFYRRHSGSTSHRLSTDALRRILDVENDWAERWPLACLQSLFRARERSIRRAMVFEELVQAIKLRQLTRAARLAASNPAAAWLLRLPVGQFIRRLRRAPEIVKNNRRQICILTGQRVVGRTNASSVYLLDIAVFLGARGFDVHLVIPSPLIMGGSLFLKLTPDMTIFESIRFRGTLRIGRYVVACDPRIGLKNMLGRWGRLLYRRGPVARPLFNPAPYATGQPLTREDQLFIARESPLIADVLIADYCCLTKAYPYALRPDARRMVIVHELLSGHSSQSSVVNTAETVVSPPLAEATRMLASAETIVAIQGDEAAVLQRRLPGHEILVAPITAVPVSSPQTGRSEIVLFVGSSTAPNIDGIRWFIELCWPKIRESRPNATLYVAGSVCDALARAPVATKLLNVVETLDHLYAEASVVVSPLRAGSGPKVKLIEALSKGKAIVATTATMQGVYDVLSGCALVADSAPVFASMVIDLLGDEGKRAELGAKGIAAVSQYFAPEHAYAAIVSAAERTDGVKTSKFRAL